MGSDLGLWVVLGVLFAVTAVLGAAEAALLRVSRVRVAVRAEDGDRRAGRLLKLIDDLPRVMNTVLLVVLLSQIGAATTAGIITERHFGGVGITVASVILTLALFVYAEAIPKTVAINHPVEVGRLLARPLGVLVMVFRPLVSALLAFADLQAPGTGVVGHLGVTEEEIRHLADEAAREGSLDPADVELVNRVFELGRRQAKDIMVPRIRMVTVPAALSVEEALAVAIQSGHRRLPVHGADVEDIVGVVRLRDLAAGVGTAVMDVAMPIMVVPENKELVDLLREMQAARCHLAVLVDEHGGTEGIVTIEDVVAELVGEVTDEPAPAEVVALASGGWSLAGSLDLDAAEDHLGFDLPHGEWTTVGGMMMGVTGRIPVVGDVVEVDSHHLRVTAATPRRVVRVAVDPQ